LNERSRDYVKLENEQPGLNGKNKRSASSDCRKSASLDNLSRSAFFHCLPRISSCFYRFDIRVAYKKICGFLVAETRESDMTDTNRTNRANVCYTDEEEKLLQIMANRLDKKGARTFVACLKIAEAVTRPNTRIIQTSDDFADTEIILVIT
jgi:hypothetical protein